MFDPKPIMLQYYKTKKLDEFPIIICYQSIQEAQEFVFSNQIKDYKIYRRII